jgi:hypothetical protein
MLRVVNTMGNLPINVEVDPNSTFEPGQIAQPKVANGACVYGRSDGTDAFGIIDDIKTSTENTTKYSGRVTIWHKRGLFETDQYDVSQLYLEGVSLFAGKDGRLTSKQNPGQQEVGICTRPPDDQNDAIRFLWLGDEM